MKVDGISGAARLLHNNVRRLSSHGLQASMALSPVHKRIKLDPSASPSPPPDAGRQPATAASQRSSAAGEVAAEAGRGDAMDVGRDDEQEHCVICLHHVRDRTVLPCAHDRLCFDCILVWTGVLFPFPVSALVLQLHSQPNRASARCATPPSGPFSSTTSGPSTTTPSTTCRPSGPRRLPMCHHGACPHRG